MARWIFCFTAAFAFSALTAGAATPEQLHAAIGSPQRVTVLDTSDWEVASDSALWATAAKSTNKGKSSSVSSLDLEVTGEGNLVFVYRVSTESASDNLKLYVDGVEKQSRSGHAGDVYSTYEQCLITGSGKHLVQLKYEKDSSVNAGEDAVWVSQMAMGVEQLLVVPAAQTSLYAGYLSGKTATDMIVFETGSQLQTVDAKTFSALKELKSIKFQEGLTTIASGAFDGCEKLTSLGLPLSLLQLGRVDTTTLTAMFDPKKNGYRVADGWVLGYKGRCPAVIPEEDEVRGFAAEALNGCADIQSFAPVTRNLNHIGDFAFYHCFGLEYVNLPDSLLTLGSGAFDGCTWLREVFIPGSLKQIKSNAFRYCYSLTDLYLGSGIEKIASEAFYDDYQLMEVDIPASVAEIGYDAFGGDSSLIRIGVRGDISSLRNFCSNFQYLREVVVKEGDKSLVSGLFENCTQLECVRFLTSEAPSLSSYGETLFKGTPETLTVYVPKGSTGWNGIVGAPALPQAWPENRTCTIRRSIAYWDLPTYLVEFDSNGGSLGIQPTYQTPETKFRLPPQPTQTGYYFMGWWTSPVEGWEVTEDTIFIEGTYKKLYAHWASGHRIYLNANGGTLTNASPILIEQTFYGALPAPVRTGYAFNGWTYQGETVVPGMEVFNAPDQTLTAEWNAYKYAVHYHPNGGQGTVTAQQFKYDTLQSLDKCRFTRDDYAFDGWATAAGGAVVYKDNQLVKNLSALQGGIVNLYAKWRLVKHTVTLVKNNGSANTTFKVMEGKNYNADLHTWIPVKPGFTFGGWWTAADGGDPIYSSKGIALANNKYWDAQRCWKGTGNVTLYAHWNPLKYTVTLVKYNGTDDSSFQVMFDRNFNSNIGGWIPVRSGYTFAGWFTAKYGTGEQIYTEAGVAIAGSACWTSDKRWKYASNITLYAKWNPKNFTVTLVPGNGSANTTLTVTYSKDTNSNIASRTPSRPGYSFAGWWTSATGGEKVYEANGLAVPNSTYWNASRGWRKAGSLTVYAHWIAGMGMLRSSAVQAKAPAGPSAVSEGADPSDVYVGRYQDGAYSLLVDDTGSTGHLTVMSTGLVLSEDCAFIALADSILAFVGDDILILER